MVQLRIAGGTLGQKIDTILYRLGAYTNIPKHLLLKSSKIFQTFDLNLEAMTKLGQEESARLNLPQAGRTLRQELSKKGYIVLESSQSLSGVPVSVIVGGDIRNDHKRDFYELAQRLGLKYGSGEYYVQIDQRE